jgi:hypothetical protein
MTEELPSGRLCWTIPPNHHKTPLLTHIAGREVLCNPHFLRSPMAPYGIYPEYVNWMMMRPEVVQRIRPYDIRITATSVGICHRRIAARIDCRTRWSSGSYAQFQTRPSRTGHQSRRFRQRRWALGARVEAVTSSRMLAKSKRCSCKGSLATGVAWTPEIYNI